MMHGCWGNFPELGILRVKTRSLRPYWCTINTALRSTPCLTRGLTANTLLGRHSVFIQHVLLPLSFFIFYFSTSLPTSHTQKSHLYTNLMNPFTKHLDCWIYIPTQQPSECCHALKRHICSESTQDDIFFGLISRYHVVNRVWEK